MIIENLKKTVSHQSGVMLFAVLHRIGKNLPYPVFQEKTGKQCVEDNSSVYYRDLALG